MEDFNKKIMDNSMDEIREENVEQNMDQVMNQGMNQFMEEIEGEIELIKPCFIGEEIEKRLVELKKVFLFMDRELKTLPEGTLYARESNRIGQYFCKMDKDNGEKKACRYIPKKDFQLAKELAQKRYYLDCKEIVEKQIKAAEKYSAVLGKTEIKAVYGALPELIQKLVSPVMLSDERYVEEWRKIGEGCTGEGSTGVGKIGVGCTGVRNAGGRSTGEEKIGAVNTGVGNTGVRNTGVAGAGVGNTGEYGGSGKYEIKGGLFTAGGTRVRSKSEVIIGNMLDRMGIPFKYELPVELKRVDRPGSYIVHPDFYCLNVRTRKEFIWEHFGMMDDAEYVEKMVKKLADYENNGWFYGQNLIFTMETSRQILDTRNVELLAKRFLL